MASDPFPVGDTWEAFYVIVSGCQNCLTVYLGGCLYSHGCSAGVNLPFDIRALRKLVKDGPLSVAPESRALIQASLSVTTTKEDDGGSIRLVKRGSNNEARDDISAALVLAAGAFQRAGSCSKTSGLSWDSRRPWHPSRQTPTGQVEGNPATCLCSGWLSLRVMLQGWPTGSGSCSTHAQAFPGDDPWAESGLQALCRGCHIQKTRLERTTPITEDQKDWATFTAK